MRKDMRCSVSIRFREVELPPCRDILVLGRQCPHGKAGISKCFNLLAPNDFELVEVKDQPVEAILVNRRLLQRIPEHKIVEVLKEKVFPYVTNGEIVNVDFKLTVEYDNVEIKVGADRQHAGKSADSKNV